MGRYRSAYTLEFPHDWDIDAFESTRYAIVFALVGLIPVLALVGWGMQFGSGGAKPGDYVAVAFWLPVVVLIYTYVWHAWPHYADVRAETVVRDGETALSIPLRPPTHTASIAMAVLGVLLVITGAAILVRYFGSDPSGGYLWFAGMGMAGAVLLVLARVSYTPVRDQADIQLTPTHLRIDDGQEVITLAWDDVSAIGTAYQPRNTGSSLRMPGTNLLAVLVRDPAALGSEAIPIADDRFHSGYLAYEFAHKQFGTDPLLTFHALTFYQRHPRLRGELGTDVGVERFFEGRYSNTAAASESES